MSSSGMLSLPIHAKAAFISYVSSNMAVNLSELPNEIIYEILLCLPPTSVPKVQQISRQFNDLSQPILWRLHCRTQFKFWNSEHEIHEKFSGAVARVEWKRIFLERHRIDHVTTRQIDGILSSQRSRIQKTESIVAHGYDAKDTLLRHLNVGDQTEDVLSRRYVFECGKDAWNER